MFTHVTVGANDVEASRRFYDAALGALGVDAAQGPDPKGR
ncbi:glyoxalase family protein, partial [Streptomyces coelicoflavus ZG0656]